MFDPNIKLPSGQVATLRVSKDGVATVDFAGTDAEIEVHDIIALTNTLINIECQDATCPYCRAGIPCH